MGRYSLHVGTRSVSLAMPRRTADLFGAKAVAAKSHPGDNLVAIPGAEATLGVGDPQRTLRLSAAESFRGAHTSNPQYFDRPDVSLPGAAARRVLRLKTVCWLSVGGTLNDVPAGSYECIVRCRITRRSGPNFVGDWKVGVGVKAQVEMYDWKKAVDDVGPLHLRHDHTQGKGGAFLSSLPTDRFSAISFGVLKLEAPSSKVNFVLGGGNPYWCSGLEFDALELRLVAPPWPVVRTLLLGADAAKQPGSDPERPGCELVRLPHEVLRMIVGLL